MSIPSSRSGPLSGRRVAVSAAVIVTAVSLFVPLATAQSARSSAAVKELAAALDSAKLESIAAVDPSDPETFVAALYMPGAQLLVVSAKYAAPPLLLDKISSKNYRDIYIDLNSASVAGSKVFIIDQSCDGLVAKPQGDNAADMFEHGTKNISFDGDWKKAKISEDAYLKAFSEADERYAKILALLIAQAKASGS
jgi:hypothetical protein